ncbi:BTB domain-containing protein [Mycena venus]|uniref:BTB domain-containing protein n=1 Tax=Mycena venus TaxID=2733690 RepID=A0A8H6YQP3_9AGAR|nr:BTB domain-containing protein [Mycena venus]
MDGTPPTKRPRIDDSDIAENAIVRCTEYWFDDGNIILQTESTQFRLTKSMLSMHSSVFRDTFMMPLPLDEPTIENCPVVILSGDTAQDWNHLLEVMYPKECFLKENPSVDLLAGVLRLSKKYDIPLFRKNYLRRLKSDYPTTLEEYDKAVVWSNIQGEDDMLIPLVSLAWEIGLHSVLPAMYYWIIASAGGDNDGYMPKLLNNKTPDLSSVDRLACLQGYIKLVELQTQTTMSWLDTTKIPVEACQGPADYRDAVKRLSMTCPESTVLSGRFTLSKHGIQIGTQLCASLVKRRRIRSSKTAERNAGTSCLPCLGCPSGRN